MKRVSENTIGGRIRILRRQQGLTQAEFAKRIFAHQTAITKWEYGRFCLRVILLYRYVRRLMCPLIGCWEYRRRKAMDREIICRGKRVDNKEWVEGESINRQVDIHGKKHVYIGLPVKSKIHPKMVTVEWVEVIPETVGECTGSPDKNGKRVFEGDFVRDTLHGDIYFIKYLTEYMRFAPARPGVVFTVMHNSRMEIIGNIHDNPKLLNADKSGGEYADGGMLKSAT